MGTSPSDDKEAETEAVLTAAKLMLISARTAPKTSGKDDILTKVITEKRIDKIARKMENIAETRKFPDSKETHRTSETHKPSS